LENGVQPIQGGHHASFRNAAVGAPVARFVFGFIFAFAAVIQFAEARAATAPSPHWVAAWAASAQGPYPVGNPNAEPELKFAFPDAAHGAVDQSLTEPALAQPQDSRPSSGA